MFYLFEPTNSTKLSLCTKTATNLLTSCKMKLIKSFISPALIALIPCLSISLPPVVSANPASDKQRFEKVAEQLDLGGVLYGYVSVDGDLSGLAKLVNSFMSDLKEIDKGISSHIPDIDIEALMKISGLDSISALGLSSIQTDQGFRNKVYLHAPNGVRGLLSMFGNEAKEFEVLQLAPSGTDLVVQQEVKLQTFYNEVVLGALGGSPEQGGQMPLGPMGMMMKMMVDGMMKQPMPPPFTFTGEKIINDLDTNIMVIIDCDPSKMQPVEVTDLNMPTIQGAVLIDNVGWLVGDLIKMFEAEKAKGRNRVPPFEVIDNKNWEGLKISTSLSPIISKVDKGEGKKTKLFGIPNIKNGMVAHHRPSGKLILSSSKEFAVNLFSQKPKLSTDPVFLAKTKGLPKQGTAISYLSPVLMTEIRKFIKEVIEAGNPPEDDRFVNRSMIDFFLPEGALGEAMVTTVTEDGLLSVGNSAYSHKSKILMGAAVPALVGAGIFSMSKPEPIIKVSSAGTATISWDHRIDGERFQHYETLDSNVTFEHTINGNHFEVRDGNVKYNGQEIARPEGSTLKIIEKAPDIFIYVDDKLVQEIRIDESP